MTKNIDAIKNALIKLKNASISIRSERDWKNTMNEYSIIFLGDKFQKINSIELNHSLNNYFSLEITNEELNILLPDICKSLNMNYEALVLAEDHSKLAGFYITLH